MPASPSWSSASSAAPVDHDHRVLDGGAALAQVARREHDLASRGHDVLDDREPAPVDVTALREPARAVGLRLLAHEQGRQPGELRQHRGERDPAELEACQRVGPSRDQWHQRLADRTQKRGVRLEQVLVEVLGAAGT